MSSRRSLPKEIQNAPEILPGLELFYNGFFRLHADRAVGMTVGPIPWSSMSAYCNEFGIVGEQRERFYQLVRSMDCTFLEWDKKKRDRESEQTRKKTRTKSQRSGRPIRSSRPEGRNRDSGSSRGRDSSSDR